MIYAYINANCKRVVFETALGEDEVQALFSDVCEAHGYSFEDKMASIADAVVLKVAPDAPVTMVGVPLGMVAEYISCMQRWEFVFPLKGCIEVHPSNPELRP